MVILVAVVVTDVDVELVFIINVVLDRRSKSLSLKRAAHAEGMNFEVALSLLSCWPHVYLE